jgi:hypothetical protein
LLATEKETTYGQYQKNHEEAFLKVAENRVKKIIPLESEVSQELILGGNSLGGNG